MVLSYLYVLDFEKGQVFKYCLHPNTDANAAWEDLCEKGKHSDSDCEWMVTSQSGLLVEDYPLKDNGVCAQCGDEPDKRNYCLSCGGEDDE